MTKHRSVVTGWDPDYVNPDTSTGRPKGVQTAIDMRIATTHDVLAEGVFAAHGTPAITGSPTDSASISPFMAAIESPLGGFYIVQLDDDENFTINMSNVGAVKIYVQQQDYEVNAAQVDSEVVIGVVYGATAIPDGALLLFTTTITSETSTSGLTFTPAFKWTGAASGVIRVPAEADLDDVAVLSVGIRALALDGSGEFFYGSDSTWHETTIANPKLEEVLDDNFNTDGTFKTGVVKESNIDFTSFSNNAKSATNTSAHTPSNGVTNNLSSASISFTLSGSGIALVTVTVGVLSTTDYEMKPGVYKNGSFFAQSDMSAAAGNGSERVNPRTYSVAVPLSNGVNTLSAGVFISSATAPNVPIGNASISAIVLGNVTA